VGVFKRALEDVLNKSLFIFISLAMAASSAFASPATVVFVDGGSNIGSGYYLSPYTGTIAPSGGQASTVALYCDDFNHEATNGQTWNAYVTSVLSSNLSNTLFGATNPNPTGPTGNTLYEEEAYLATQIQTNFAANNLSAIEAIQDAMWVLTDSPTNPSNPVPNAGSAAVQNWLNLATADVANYQSTGNSAVNYGNWYVLTDTNTRNPHQEFLFYASDSHLFQTPEPATMALAGCGLLAVYFAGVRRKKNLA
jgi:hypothetical protein